MNLADSYGPIAPATLKANGFGGIMRYVSHQAGKCITRTEAEEYRAAGLVVGLVFEDGANNAAGGAASGAADGEFAAGVCEKVGYPANCVLFGAVDFAPASWQIPTVESYFRSFRGHGYPTGPYGDNAVVNAVMSIGMGTAAWQTSAWSAGVLSKLANLYQDRYGQWWDSSKLEQWTPLWGMAAIVAPAAVPVQGAKMNYVGPMARTPDGKGGWLAKPDGSVITLGDADFHGGLSGTKLARPIVGIAAHPTSGGYILAGADGGIFPFGPGVADHGNPSGVELVQPIDGITMTPSGNGYWLTASDGGVFPYGDAAQLGSGVGK